MDAASSSRRSIFQEINDRSNKDFSFDTYVPPHVIPRVLHAVMPSVSRPCELALQLHPDFLGGLKFSWILECAARDAQIQNEGYIPRNNYAFKVQCEYEMPVAGYGDRMHRLSIARGGTAWYASDYHFENSCIRWWHRQGCKVVRAQGYYWFHFKHIRTNLAGESCDFNEAEKAKKNRLDYSWY